MVEAVTVGKRQALVWALVQTVLMSVVVVVVVAYKKLYSIV